MVTLRIRFPAPQSLLLMFVVVFVVAAAVCLVTFLY